MTKMSGDARTVITLDGPAASGKSSVARLLAQRLGIAYVSSGLLYRAATLTALESGVDPTSESAMARLLASCSVRLLPRPDGNRVEVDGRDVTEWLHTDAVDAAVSAVARQEGVRAWVNERLKELEGSFVIDGRDMGTAVFPRASHKFYLTAPVEERARRRLSERSGDLESIAQALRHRDALDAKQSVPAPDALHLDTGPLTLNEVVETVAGLIERHAAPAR
ncbi:MAG: (d)CMP kinase [Trueperaceae bacterium]|nr:(d)CMP kinase [Trueperaceae bacterium]